MSNDPILAVVVALIPDAEGRLLWTFNDRWGSFTLPMTKVRRGSRFTEPFARAALRAGAEALGVPVCAVAGCPTQTFLQRAFSERRQQEWQYNYYVHVIQPHPGWSGRLQIRQPHLWLTVPQALEDELEPLADSSRLVLRRARSLLSLLPQNATRRHSSGGLALIRRDVQGTSRWLAQWNERWGGYHFIGGRLRASDATFHDCVVREVAEELEIRAGIDFRVAPQPTFHLDYTAWSESTRTETDYTMELFAVEILTPETYQQIDANPGNRWLTAGEIRSRHCEDGRPVSGTMRDLLDRVDWKAT